jgi:hypothetical protein
MARLYDANTIINRAAVECGLLKDPNPLDSQDESFVQLSELLNAAGQEMVELNPWQILEKPFTVLTQDTDSGSYDLPDDFAYMMDQTGWEHTNRLPMGGPLSSQDWAWLEGRNLINSTMYASFQLQNNKFDIYPNNPVPEGLDIHFQYISRNWVQPEGSPAPATRDMVEAGTDIVFYEPILIIKFLKLKFLLAKGFDAQAAITEFETLFDGRVGRDTGATILSASNSRGIFPYLDMYTSVPFTGYGR